MQGGLGFNVVLQGAMVTCITLAAYFVGCCMESGRWETAESSHGMTMAFLTLSMAEIFHSFSMHSLKQSVFQMRRRNEYLLGAMLLSLVGTTAVIYVPFLTRAFGFAHISLTEWMVSLLLAVLVIPVVEIVKLIQRKKEAELLRLKL